MVKRFAALLFILAMAGHAAAGVCRCLGGADDPGHSCCKRQKGGTDSMRRASCCDTDCAMQSGGTSQPARVESAAKITFTIEVLAARKNTLARPVPAFTERTAIAFIDHHRLKHSRPPDLYLRHHAFLI
jgi:hypothetical protein